MGVMRALGSEGRWWSQRGKLPGGTEETQELGARCREGRGPTRVRERERAVAESCGGKSAVGSSRVVSGDQGDAPWSWGLGEKVTGVGRGRSTSVVGALERGGKWGAVMIWGCLDMVGAHGLAVEDSGLGFDTILASVVLSRFSLRASVSS